MSDEAPRRAEGERPTGTVLGFDFGRRRIGVAVGQGITASARPLTTLTSRDDRIDFEAIGRLIGEWQPQALVVGLPLNTDGSEHDLTRRARRFRNQLAGRYNLPVHLVDERLTSVEAERQRPGYRRGAKGEIDRIAAQIILQSWFDGHGVTTGTP